MLEEIYQKGNEKIEKEFSLERVLVQLRSLKALLKHNDWFDKETKRLL